MGRGRVLRGRDSFRVLSSLCLGLGVIAGLEVGEGVGGRLSTRFFGCRLCDDILLCLFDMVFLS